MTIQYNTKLVECGHVNLMVDGSKPTLADFSSFNPKLKQKRHSHPFQMYQKFTTDKGEPQVVKNHKNIIQGIQDNKLK